MSKEVLRTTLLAEAEKLESAAEKIVARTGDKRSVSDDADLELALGRARKLRKLAPKAKRSAVTSVREPDLFGPSSGRSWLLTYAAARAIVPVPGLSPLEANDLLRRHASFEAGKRMALDAKARARRTHYGVTSDAPGLGSAMASRSGEIVQRDLSLTAGQGGELSPPLWMLDQFASVARSAAPLLGAVTTVPLPDGCQTVYIPRATVVGSVVPMGTENVNPPIAWQATDQISSPVATLAGVIPMSAQFADRGPNIDGFLSRDFGENYAAAAESLLLNGTGTGDQPIGILNVPTTSTDGVPPANAVTYTAATPTTAGVVQSIGKAAATVGNKRLRPASAVVMTPERFAWLAGYPDGSGDVAALRPGTGGDLLGDDTKPWGPIAGLPVYLDASLPQDLGAGGDQDIIAACRPKDVIYLASAPSFDVVVDTSAGASSLTVFARYWVYVSAFTTRYPSAICTVQGTGLDRTAMGW